MLILLKEWRGNLEEALRLIYDIEISSQINLNLLQLLQKWAMLKVKNCFTLR